MDSEGTRRKTIVENIILDLNNYNAEGSVFKRTAARGIVERDGKYLIVYSKYGDCKFPGGGREDGETLEETLIREVQEETGYVVIRKSVKEYIKVQEKRKGLFEDVLEMDSYYFLCNVEADAGNRDLDDYEKEYDYQVAWLPLKEIIKRNESVDKFEKIPWIIRENIVMKSIIDKGQE